MKTYENATVKHIKIHKKKKECNERIPFLKIFKSALLFAAAARTKASAFTIGITLKI